MALGEWVGAGEHSACAATSSGVILPPPRCWKFFLASIACVPRERGVWILGDVRVLTIHGPSAPAERSVALTSLRPAKAEGLSRLRRQPRMRLDPVEPTDTPVSSSSSSSQSSTSCLPHLPRKRFQMYSKSPFYRAGGHGEGPETRASPEGLTGPLHCPEDRPQFTTRGTFNPEKGKQKLKSVKSSPAKTKEPPDGGPGGGHKRNPEADCATTQPLVLLGSNEFMV